MVSSVSSERVFSGGGITISKHSSRLKGDVIEVFQVLKCAIRTDLLVRPPMPSPSVEEMLMADDQEEEELAQETDTYLKKRFMNEDNIDLNIILDSGDEDE